MLIISNIGDQVWLMTSRQTEPDLQHPRVLARLTRPMHVFGANHLQFIDIRVEDSIDEADARGFVRILVGELDVNFPYAVLEGCWAVLASCDMLDLWTQWTIQLTLCRALESHVELLPTTP